MGRSRAEGRPPWELPVRSATNFLPLQEQPIERLSPTLPDPSSSHQYRHPLGPAPTLPPPLEPYVRLKKGNPTEPKTWHGPDPRALSQVQSVTLQQPTRASPFATLKPPTHNAPSMNRKDSQDSEQSRSSASSHNTARSGNSQSFGIGRANTREGHVQLEGAGESSQPGVDTGDHRIPAAMLERSPQSPVRARRTRVLLTRMQWTALNRLWSQTTFPPTSEREALAAEIGLTPRQVQVWFQNQRQKRRREGDGADEDAAARDTQSGTPQSWGTQPMTSAQGAQARPVAQPWGGASDQERHPAEAALDHQITGGYPPAHWAEPGDRLPPLSQVARRPSSAYEQASSSLAHSPQPRRPSSSTPQRQGRSSVYRPPSPYYIPTDFSRESRPYVLSSPQFQYRPDEWPQLPERRATAPITTGRYANDGPGPSRSSRSHSFNATISARPYPDLQHGFSSSSRRGLSPRHGSTEPTSGYAMFQSSVDSRSQVNYFPASFADEQWSTLPDSGSRYQINVSPHGSPKTPGGTGLPPSLSQLVLDRPVPNNPARSHIPTLPGHPPNWPSDERRSSKDPSSPGRGGQRVGSRASVYSVQHIPSVSSSSASMFMDDRQTGQETTDDQESDRRSTITTMPSIANLLNRPEP